MGPPRKIDIFLTFFFYFSGPRKKWAQMGPGGFFPTNPDRADILGRTDFDFENFYFLGSQLGPGLGPAWAQLGPGLGPGLGPAWARAWAHPLGPSWGPLKP